MNCCAPKITRYYNKEQLLEKLKNIDDLNINMNLNTYKFEHDANRAKWKGNLGKETPLMVKKYDEEIIELNQQLFKKNEKIEQLRKIYLAKLAKLLCMAQTHCQIKSENEKLFEKCGIKIEKFEKKPETTKILEEIKTDIKKENNNDGNEKDKDKDLERDKDKDKGIEKEKDKDKDNVINLEEI